MTASKPDKPLGASEIENAASRDDYAIKDLAMAKQAADEEHNLGFREAMRRYPQAAMWSVLVSASIIMEGYDIVLISSFFAQESFRKQYGE